MPEPKIRAPRNRTLCLSPADRQRLQSRLVKQPAERPLSGVTIHGDCLSVIGKLPRGTVDLMILDPPYNLNKTFGDNVFSRRPIEEYSKWLESVLVALTPLLKSTATVYICGDWHTSASILDVASRHLIVRNRITWEREKGRGAKTNWKNSSEDVWFCTVTETYTFNVGAVKLRRKVLAPYRTEDNVPKDWNETDAGNYRDTHPSNLWTDITIPFWSMQENTDHPAQKSEKLIAKLILASSDRGQLVFDPFLGSGTTSVVSKKLDRNFIGIELNEEYCLLAERRLELAEADRAIQGYTDGVFWERNSLQVQTRIQSKGSDMRVHSLFDTSIVR